MSRVEFDEALLKKLFSVRSDEYESEFIKEHEEQLKKKGTRKKQKKLFDTLEKYIDKNSEDYSNLVHLFDIFEGAYIEEIDYWMEKYYKLGFSDAFKLKKEIKNTGWCEDIEKSFLDEYSDDFNEYIDKSRVFKWMNKTEYKKINKEICDIKLKYPRVNAYLEDGKIEQLTKNELKALTQIIGLKHQIDEIEEKEIFKLGMKENYIYFESMDMLNI